MLYPINNNRDASGEGEGSRPPPPEPAGSSSGSSGRLLLGHNFKRLKWLSCRFLLERKSIPFPRQSLHVSRPLGRVAQRLAEARDCQVQAVVPIDESAIRPDLLPQFFAG